MASSNVGFQEVVEWAAHLSPEERSRLVACIGAEANAVPSSPHSDSQYGSPTAVLEAMREPPHLSAEDVAELELAITAGKQTLRQEGIFDRGEAR